MKHLIICIIAAFCSIKESLAKMVETPYQWVEYCKFEGETDPSCNDKIDSPKTSKFKDDDLLVTLREVNFKYNVFRFTTDRVKYGKEDKWSATLGDKTSGDFYYAVRGDCDDYVLSKRKELLSRGIPNSMMYVTLVKVHHFANEMHMILVVKNGRKYYVLDNINTNIVETVDTNYIGLFHMNPIDKKWYTIHPKTFR